VNAVRRLALLDRGWCRTANRWGARHLVRAYFRAISRLGDGECWVALIALAAFADAWRGTTVSLQLAATALIAALLYRRLKGWTRRPRPFRRDRTIHAWIAPLDEYSFPSGHTLHAVSLTSVALASYPALAWVLVPFTLSVAASRVVLGVHYPSDVLAAAVLGGTLAAAVLAVSALA
jgi:undecaprenyl-diphosphatase